MCDITELLLVRDCHSFFPLTIKFICITKKKNKLILETLLLRHCILFFTCSYGSGDTLVDHLLKILTRDKQDFVWAQQYFTMTDQLNMGSRYFMLNPVYLWDAMRLCHCGLDSPALDKVISFIEKVSDVDVRGYKGVGSGCPCSGIVYNTLIFLE